MSAKSIFSYTIILLLIFNISAATLFSNEFFLFGLGLILLSYQLFIAQKPLDNKLIGFVLIFILINEASYYINGPVYQQISIFKFAINLLILPYLTLKIIGKSFWIKFEKLVFILTAISIPIFLLSLLLPGLFLSLGNIFRPLTNNIFYSSDTNRTYWSSLIFVFNPGQWQINRNSGFMWEPGAFAMMINWAIIYNYFSSRMKFNRKIIIYIIALFSTFSTAGYLAFFVFLIGTVIKSSSIKYQIPLLIVVVFFAIYLSNLDFIGDKLDIYVSQYQENEVVDNAYLKPKLNRLQIFFYEIEQTLKYPFGFGNETDFKFIGDNGLSKILVMWGIPVFLYLLYLLKKYLDFIDISNEKKISLIFFVLSLLIPFFSNPIGKNVFFYFIVLTPVAFEKSLIKKRQLQIKKYLLKYGKET
ncbi:MAG: hypothetical protein WCL70_05525 [Paludibacter sp.]